MNHKNMDVWKLSMDLVTKIYQITGKFPIEERFGLSQQLRRASVSIPSNIAEGAARKSPNELIQFLYIALGSMAELETQLMIGERLGFMLEENNEPYATCDRVRQMLIGLIRYKKG